MLGVVEAWSGREAVDETPRLIPSYLRTAEPAQPQGESERDSSRHAAPPRPSLSLPFLYYFSLHRIVE